MKADRMGTHTEQVRFRMGWQSPAERKALGAAAPDGVCINCKHHYLKEIPNRDGGAASNYSTYCGHPHAAGEFGHATRDTAHCDRYERSL